MCTRAFNNSNKKFLSTARNMDWATQLPTSFFTFKKGLVKSGMEEFTEKTLTWTSLYDSVVAMVGDQKSGYASSDGINSEGLVANVLYDSNAEYERESGITGQELNVLRWVQYVLDNFKSVAEAVSRFGKNDILIIGSKVPSSDKPATLHLSISDISGDSAIIEMVKGKFCIHHNADYTIMTNEPDFGTQLKLNDYWRWQWSSENSFPSQTIPGGPFPANRFERAAFYLHHINKPESADESLAQVKSVVANASVPIGLNLAIESHPNIAPTLWSTIANQNELTYYFSNARTPNTVWVDLRELPSESKVLMLELVEKKDDDCFVNHNFNGCVNSQLTAIVDPYEKI